MMYKLNVTVRRSDVWNCRLVGVVLNYVEYDVQTNGAVRHSDVWNCRLVGVVLNYVEYDVQTQCYRQAF